jgi:hypothetical protein
MTTKADFNAEEWEQVTGGPALAGLIVIAAQRGGTIRETVAMAKVYSAARAEHGDSDLLGELVATPPRVDQKQFTSAEDLRTRGLGLITQAVALVEAKATPEELEAYRAFALTVAQRAAEADKSGGFLGVGGERVTEAESAALDDVAGALGTERPPAAETDS